MIIVQSPLRVSFFGGGTDFPDYYQKHGGCVLSSCIDKYIFVTVKERFDRKLRIGYTRTELVDRVDEIEHGLIREALRKTGVTEGVEITTMGDIPSAGSGLGSSSTVTVGALQALYTYLGEIVTAERLAKEACEIEIDILGKPIGVQDQYIAAYGGLCFMDFSSDGGIQVEPLSLSTQARRMLNDNLMLFFTGITRQADAILMEQKANIENRLHVLGEMKDLASLARKALLAGDFDELGHMLHYGWKLKRQLASKISNPYLDELYDKARGAGALGGKITGAGGGGFLLLYCPREKQGAVRASLPELQELPFQLEQDGAKVIFNYRRSARKPSSEKRRRKVKVLNNHQLSLQPEAIQILPQPTGAAMPSRSLPEYISQMHATLDQLPMRDVQRVVDVLHAARMEERQIFIMGNGGSAATATHFVCDLSKNTRDPACPDFRVLGLTDNISILSAYANDEGYENVFLKPLNSLLRPHDVVMAFSASGNSENVIRAIKHANERKATTIGFTGFDGGRLKEMADLCVHVPSDCIEQVEDIHLILEHMITREVRALGMEAAGQEVPIGRAGMVRWDREHVRNLYETSRQLIPLMERVEDIRLVLRLMIDRLAGKSGSILVMDRDGAVIGAAVAHDGEIRDLSQEDALEVLEKGLAGWVAGNRRPALVQSTLKDPRWLRREWEDTRPTPRSAICVPMNVRDKALAVLTIAKSGEESFTERDLSLLAALSICAGMTYSDISLGPASDLEVA